jgi:phosphoglycolate phosphatase
MFNYIFDIDGTLVDSEKLVIRAIVFSASLLGYHLTPSDMTLFRQVGTKKFLLIKKIPLLTAIFIDFLSQVYKSRHLQEIKTFPEIYHLLSQLKKTGKTVGVISSNKFWLIGKILQSCQLIDFDFVSHAGLFNKSVYIKKILKKYHLNPTETLYVGDEVRDIEAARQAGVKVASVTWGFNSRAALSKYSPDYIINHPQDLLTIT